MSSDELMRPSWFGLGPGFGLGLGLGSGSGVELARILTPVLTRHGPYS